MNVAILGASAKKERYSYKALRELISHGHKVFPVNPFLDEIDGCKVFHSLAEIGENIDTITVYLSPEHSSDLFEQILNKNPKRIIFNPGAENPELAKKLEEKGIQIINACTIVMLKTGTF